MSIFIVEVFGKDSVEWFSRQRIWSQYDNFSGKIVLKGNFISDSGKAPSSLHFHCSGLRETELWAVLPVEKASSWYDSFSGKIILKGPLIGDSDKVSAHLFKSWEDSPSSHSPRRQRLWDHMIVLVIRLSGKLHSSVTLGKPLHSYCSG